MLAGSKSRRSRAAGASGCPPMISLSWSAFLIGPCSARNRTMASAWCCRIPGISQSSDGFARFTRTLDMVESSAVAPVANARPVTLDGRGCRSASCSPLPCPSKHRVQHPKVERLRQELDTEALDLTPRPGTRVARHDHDAGTGIELTD